MVTSDLAHIQGEGIEVGTHGDTSFLYEEGSPVNNQGGSAIAFEAGTGLGGGGVIDDFERGNLNPYNDTGDFGITSNSIEGDFAVEVTGHGEDGVISTMWSKSGLPNYPGEDDRFAVNFVLPDTSARADFWFGFQDVNNSYRVLYTGAKNELQIETRKNGSNFESEVISVSLAANTNYYFFMFWRSFGDKTIEMYQGKSFDATDDTLVASGTLNSTEFDGSGFDTGIGFGAQTANDVGTRYDMVEFA